MEKGEARIQRKEEIRRAIGQKMARTPNPWLDMRLQYGTNKGKYFTEESDRFMVRPGEACRLFLVHSSLHLSAPGLSLSSCRKQLAATRCRDRKWC